MRRPTQVRLRSESTTSEPVAVGPTGEVALRTPIAGRRFRLEILRSAWPQGTPGTERRRRAVGIAEVRGTGVPSVDVRRDGTLGSDCSALTVSAGAARFGLSLDGNTSVADFDAGRPLPITSCDRVELPAGETRISAPPGVFTPYVLRLRSGAASDTAAAPGRVVSAGTATRGGRQGVRLQLDAPARLVLAEAYNRGRRATCDGRDLGVPEVGGVYGTAWRVPKACKEVEISFGPNRIVYAGYALSLLAALVLLALLALRRPATTATERQPLREEATEPLTAGRAALLTIPLALAFGFVFAARGTPLFALGVFFVLWRGIGARALALAGGAVLTIAVPILTVLIRPENRGGYNPEYSINRIVVHWAAVAGVALLILALGRALSTARARTSRARAAPPSSAAPPAPAP